MRYSANIVLFVQTLNTKFVQNLILIDRNTPNNILLRNMKLKQCMMYYNVIQNNKT